LSSYFITFDSCYDYLGCPNVLVALTYVWNV